MQENNMKKIKDAIKLEISSEDDRRTLCAILAENGYSVHVECKEAGPYVAYNSEDKYFVVVQLIK